MGDDDDDDCTPEDCIIVIGPRLVEPEPSIEVEGGGGGGGFITVAGAFSSFNLPNTGADCLFCFERLGLLPLDENICKAFTAVGDTIDSFSGQVVKVGADFVTVGIALTPFTKGTSNVLTGAGASAISLGSLGSLTGNTIRSLGTGNFDRVLAGAVSTVIKGGSKSALAELLGVKVDQIVLQMVPRDKCRSRE